MTTKQEYIDVLGQMEELYYNSDNCMLAMNLFKEDINLLAGLVNEYFEEKKEMNFEYFKNEIKDKKFDFAIIDGKVLQCKGCLCDECLFHSSEGTCDVTKIKWLYKQHKKKYKLTQFEYDLLSSYAKGYKFKDINSLNGMKEKGYFKGIDDNELIGEILAKCEVV